MLDITKGGFGQWSFIHGIISERERQDKKWGVQDHSPVDWYRILGEEFGEVAKAINEGNYCTTTKGNYREELVHLASVCMAAYESDIRAKENNDGNTKTNAPFEDAYPPTSCGKGY